MTTAAFIIGMIILGLCIVAAAVILSGSISGAATALKESAPQSMQQPTLTFLTEYDAADYLGISLNELDYIRSEGLLEGAFIAVTSLEQTGEESYVDYEDGIEVGKSRPVMSNVTRFLFNRQLLDEKMMEAIKDGRHINPFRAKAQEKKNSGKKNGKSGGEGNKNKQPVVKLFEDDDEPVVQDTTEAIKPEDVSTEKVSIDDIAPAVEPEKEPEEEKKPAAAGPRLPMGPIGDDDNSSADDDTDAVIDIMASAYKAKQQNDHPNGNRPNGGKPNGNRSNNGNRPNGNRPNGNRPHNGNRPNNGGHN